MVGVANKTHLASEMRWFGVGSGFAKKWFDFFWPGLLKEGFDFTGRSPFEELTKQVCCDDGTDCGNDILSGDFHVVI